MSIERLLSLSIALLAVSSLIQSLEYLRYDSAALFSGWKKHGFQLGRALLLLGSLVAFMTQSFLAPALIFSGSLLIVFVNHGPFNGGSDSMTLCASLCLGIAALSEHAAPFAMGYLGALVIISYFAAGVSKALRASWWSGEALHSYLSQSSYDVPERLRRLSHRQCQLLSVIVLGFEIGFPWLLWSQQLTVAFLGLAAFFHFANFVAFGLNRFCFAWIAGYPAVFFLSLASV